MATSVPRALPLPGHPHPARFPFHPRPGLPQFRGERLEVFGPGILDQHVAAGEGRAHHERARLDPVRTHLVRHAVELVHPFDPNDLAARAAHPGAHPVQHLGQFRDLGLPGGVADHRLPAGQGRRHHEVLGGAHGRKRERDLGATKLPGAGVDVAVVLAYDRAHALQPLEVQIHRPRTDGATAGCRHAGFAEPRQQRPQHQKRSAHGLDQVIGGLAFMDLVRRKLQASVRHHVPLDGHPQAREQPQGGPDVTERRHPVVGALVRGQKRRNEHRKSRVLRPPERHRALQNRSAPDDDAVQDLRPLDSCKARQPAPQEPRCRGGFEPARDRAVLPAGTGS